MRSKFWRIDAPDYGEDGYNRRLFVNGVGSHAFALPGYTCDLCGGQAGQRILPVPWIEPEDVANAVLYLASEKARFVTGSQFVIDAGLLTR